MRRLLPLLVLLAVASTASAAVVHGSRHGGLIAGTPRADHLIGGVAADRIQSAFGGIDSVTCGAGADIVSADTGDHVAASCEILSRRLSVDPYTNLVSQHETAVEPDSFAANGTVVAAFQVGRRGTGAAANIGTSVSSDGGRTWLRSLLPGTTVEATPPGTQIAVSDPAVAYDAVHGFWLASALAIERASSHIYVARSTDGKSWSPPVDAADGPQLDKDWIACDNGASSPLRGRCYLEYSDDAKNTTVSQYSTDGGATWSPPVRAGDILVGTQPVIEPDGTLVVVAGDYPNEDALSGRMVALRSTDGGATFTRIVVASFRAADNDPMRAISLPSVDADPSGTIYAVWPDCRFRAGCTRNDMVLSTSQNGVTWSTPTRIALAPTASARSFFIPGVAADPARPGHLALVYAFFYAGGCMGAACKLGFGIAQSTNGGSSWKTQRLDAQPVPVTWVPRAEGGRMVGDYFSVSYVGDRVVPVFALAAPPLRGRYREGIFETSIRALG
jgi:hypothetical protein